MSSKIRYFSTENQSIGRLEETEEDYRNAEVLREGEWVSVPPAELLWNAGPISREEAIERYLHYHPEVTEDELRGLLERR